MNFDALGICGGEDGIDGVLHQRCELDFSHLKPELAGDNAGSVKKIIDEGSFVHRRCF